MPVLIKTHFSSFQSKKLLNNVYWCFTLLATVARQTLRQTIVARQTLRQTIVARQ